MQVACLCLFMCLPDCWSAHQRNRRREKTKRDKTEIEKKKVIIKYNILLCRDLNSAFTRHISRPVTLQDSHLKNCFPRTGQTSRECPCNY